METKSRALIVALSILCAIQFIILSVIAITWMNRELESAAISQVFDQLRASDHNPARLRQIDVSKCPSDFQRAWLRYVITVAGAQEKGLIGKVASLPDVLDAKLNLHIAASQHGVRFEVDESGRK